MALFGFEGLLTVLALAGAFGDDGGAGSVSGAEDPDEARRREMVATQIEARGIDDPRVLEAMRSGPAPSASCPPTLRHEAYRDGPLPIGHEQTISQPYIVALMTELIRPRADDEGARDRHRLGLPGGGAGRVRRTRSTPIEIVPELGRQAAELLDASRLRQRAHAHRRRLRRLARGGAVRRHPGHRGAGRGPAAAAGPARRRGPAGHPRRPGQPGPRRRHAHRGRASSGVR